MTTQTTAFTSGMSASIQYLKVESRLPGGAFDNNRLRRRKLNLGDGGDLGNWKLWR